MQTTLEQQVRAIRMAIRFLETERRDVREREIDGESVADALAEIDGEIAALRDATTALQGAAAFRQSLKSFIDG